MKTGLLLGQEALWALPTREACKDLGITVTLIEPVLKNRQLGLDVDCAVGHERTRVLYSRVEVLVVQGASSVAGVLHPSPCQSRPPYPPCSLLD